MFGTASASSAPASTNWATMTTTIQQRINQEGPRHSLPWARRKLNELILWADLTERNAGHSGCSDVVVVADRRTQSTTLDAFLSQYDPEQLLRMVDAPPGGSQWQSAYPSPLEQSIKKKLPVFVEKMLRAAYVSCTAADGCGVVQFRQWITGSPAHRNIHSALHATRSPADESELPPAIECAARALIQRPTRADSSLTRPTTLGLLLAYGADPSALDEGNFSPLNVACEGSPANDFALLVCMGASFRPRSSPVSSAASFNRTQLLRILLGTRAVDHHAPIISHSAAFNAVMTSEGTVGRTALRAGWMSIDSSCAAIIEFLLMFCGQCDIPPL